MTHGLLRTCLMRAGINHQVKRALGARRQFLDGPRQRPVLPASDAIRPRWKPLAEMEKQQGSRIVDFGQSSMMRRSADAGISSTTCIAVASLTMPQARDQITDQHGALASLDRCVSDREI